MAEGVLTDMERDGLTLWGEAISAQFRDEGQLAVYIKSNAPRDVDDVTMLPPSDVAKLYALLEEAKGRGAWPA